VHKKVNFIPSSSAAPTRHLAQQHNQYHSTSEDGQFEEDDYTEYDEGDEYFEQPWNLSKQEAMFPKQLYSTPPQQQQLTQSPLPPTNPSKTHSAIRVQPIYTIFNQTQQTLIKHSEIGHTNIPY
jgi:hypothetical protein